MRPVESGNPTARHNLVEIAETTHNLVKIAEACRKEAEDSQATVGGKRNIQIGWPESWLCPICGNSSC